MGVFTGVYLRETSVPLNIPEDNELQAHPLYAYGKNAGQRMRSNIVSHPPGLGVTPRGQFEPLQFIL